MARPRKPKGELTGSPNTPDRQLTLPSGFCMTGHHDDCPLQFSHGKCGCKCHTNIKERVDPRPWMKK
jgi:hypothetical protein